jgi:hypothetical protein
MIYQVVVQDYKFKDIKIITEKFENSMLRYFLQEFGYAPTCLNKIKEEKVIHGVVYINTSINIKQSKDFQEDWYHIAKNFIREQKLSELV